MDFYFKLMTIFKFIIPAIIVGIIILLIIYFVVKDSIKSRLMEKLGYTYDRGLGSNVAYEYQPHWIKGNIKINCREISSKSRSEIKAFIKSKENRM